MDEKYDLSTYNYRVYGLNIKSQIEIDEFIKIDNLDDKDIHVNYLYGDMPDKFNDLREEGRLSFYSKNESFFHIDNVASYYIANGDTVIVKPCENGDKKLINVYLMCSCLGFIMLQREIVAIHGGTVVMNNKAVILTGYRGAGKSTLSTALRLKGYKFISDDVASTYYDDGIKVYHGFPYQKLCEDAMDKLEYEKEKYSSFKSDTQVKYMVPAFEEFVYEDTSLAALVEIASDDCEEVKIEEVKGTQKLNKLIKNIYREEFLPHLGGITPSYFKKCLDIAKNIKCYKITRPNGQFTVERQIELLEETLS